MNLAIRELVAASRILLATRNSSHRGRRIKREEFKGSSGRGGSADGDRRAVVLAVAACKEAVRARYGSVSQGVYLKLLRANMVLNFPEEEVDIYLDSVMSF